VKSNALDVNLKAIDRHIKINISSI